MDLMTIQKRNYNLSNRVYPPPVTVNSGSSDAAEERLSDAVKRVNASKPFANRWGGKDYPVDINDYGQFLSTMQTLSWVLADIGYESHYLTTGGLTYSSTNYVMHPGLFDRSSGKIVAMVAVGKDGSCFRFSRGGGKLRVRKFTNLTRALAPLRGDDPGSQPLTTQTIKEIVRLMRSQSLLNPADARSMQRWGKLVQSRALKPIGGGPLKNQLKIVFSKVK
jgi:hypothetical protein